MTERNPNHDKLGRFSSGDSSGAVQGAETHGHIKKFASALGHGAGKAYSAIGGKAGAAKLAILGMSAVATVAAVKAHREQNAHDLKHGRYYPKRDAMEQSRYYSMRDASEKRGKK